MVVYNKNNDLIIQKFTKMFVMINNMIINSDYFHFKEQELNIIYSFNKLSKE